MKRVDVSIPPRILFATAHRGHQTQVGVGCSGSAVDQSEHDWWYVYASVSVHCWPALVYVDCLSNLRLVPPVGSCDQDPVRD